MCQYINVSAVKKVIKDKDRQCGSGFLSALDQFVFKSVEDACTVRNGGAKRLDAFIFGVTKESKSVSKNIEKALVQVRCLELKVNTISRKEYLDHLSEIRRLFESELPQQKETNG